MATEPYTMHFLLHSAALLEDKLRERLADIGIRPRQARIIDALSKMEPASQVSLAREFAITPASMSTMTVRLIDAGLISRESHPDEARSKVLRLTEKGRSLLSDVHAAWRDMDGLIAEQIGAAETTALARITRDLRDSLGGRVPGANALSSRKDTA